MADLRRRLFRGRDPHGDGSSPEPSRTPSPAPIPAEKTTRSRSVPDISTNAPSTIPEGLVNGSEDTVSVPVKKLEKLNKHLQVPRAKHNRKRNAWIFGLGGLFGILVAVAFAGNSNESLNFAHLREIGLDSLMDVLPAGLIKDAQELQKHERETTNYDSFAVGLAARSQGVSAQHPVIMIPGVISTGLESWGTEDDSRQYFRKRLWGSWSMMRALVLDKTSWKKHIMLDRFTGLDPPGVKLRAAQGFDAADFFITGFWIWNKILENLATIGYDPSNAFTASYDWRLSYSNLEVRDQFFSRLKNWIELSVQIGGKKAVLLSHSMGSQVLYYFFHWVEAEGEGFGNGGDGWVNRHIESWINISGCMLGALKGVPAVLSGEMKDTAQLNAFAVYGLEKFLSRHERAEIFRAMPGISSMLPIGGNEVWGDEQGAPDDLPGQNTSFGQFITFRTNHAPINVPPETKLENSDPTSPENHIVNLTVAQALPYLLSHSEPWYADMIKANYSHGVAHTKQEVERNEKDPGKWINPLETRLPLAPNMTIYCFYGVGKPTERSYYYRKDTDPFARTNVSIDTAYTRPGGPSPELELGVGIGNHSNKKEQIVDTNGPLALDDEAEAVPSWAPPVDHGVIMGEGDGTVNLLSTGYMCARGWRDIKRYNPGNVKIKIYEMPHEPDRFNPRGGPNTGDHVDILGRSGLNELILQVAGGKGSSIEEHLVSNIMDYSKKVKIFEDEETQEE